MFLFSFFADYVAIRLFIMKMIQSSSDRSSKQSMNSTLRTGMKYQIQVKIAIALILLNFISLIRWRSWGHCTMKCWKHTTANTALARKSILSTSKYPSLFIPSKKERQNRLAVRRVIRRHNVLVLIRLINQILGVFFLRFLRFLYWRLPFLRGVKRVPVLKREKRPLQKSYHAKFSTIWFLFVED